MVTPYQLLLVLVPALVALQALFQALAQVVAQVLTLALPHIQTDLPLLPFLMEFLELLEHQAGYL